MRRGRLRAASCFSVVGRRYLRDVLANVVDEAAAASPAIAYAYLAGARRDGTYSARHRTLRITQGTREWLDVLQVLVDRLGKTSWIYREGRSRRVWAIETTCVVDPMPRLAARDELVAFVRGYFDAEGGIPRSPRARFYVQLCQKDRDDLLHLKALMTRLGIDTGSLHNPSRRIDPSYWRFYVRAHHLGLFASAVGSWHPIKRSILDARFSGPTDAYSGRTTLNRPKPSA